jgi:hypothetical protein
MLVTSRAHSRRVRATWHALVGDAPQAVVRSATDDPYDPARWWRHTRDALAVSREVFGLLNVWAGVPVRQEGPYRGPLPGRGARCRGNRSRHIRREARLTRCRARDDAP